VGTFSPLVGFYFATFYQTQPHMLEVYSKTDLLENRVLASQNHQIAAKDVVVGKQEYIDEEIQNI
jgi:hypothetical protein